MAEAEPIRCGIFGPGRRRNGLGPFLAVASERAGLAVVAAAGRDRERTRADAAALAQDLGHPVAAHGDLGAMLGASDLDALIVATPPAAHREGLAAGLAAGLHVLCEKPLLPFGAADDPAAVVGALCDGFVAKRRVLAENCQWPFVLRAFDALRPGWRREPIGAVAMGLSPSGRGRALVEDSLSHLLSVLQALLPVDASTAATAIRYSAGAPDAEASVLEFEFAEPFPPVAVRLELERTERQPRPAWIEVDGARFDRRVRMRDYAMSMAAGEREVPIDDPLGLCVYRFAERIREAHLDAIRTDADAIRHRARLYEALVAAW